MPCPKSQALYNTLFEVINGYLCFKFYKRFLTKMTYQLFGLSVLATKLLSVRLCYRCLALTNLALTE